MKPLAREYDVIRQRLGEIDAELQSIRRLTAVEGHDLRHQWDKLFRERVDLAWRLAPDDYGPTSSRYLLLLTLCIAILSVAMYRSHQGNTKWVAVWFLLGLLNGGYLIASRNRRAAHAANRALWEFGSAYHAPLGDHSVAR